MKLRGKFKRWWGVFPVLLALGWVARAIMAEPNQTSPWPRDIPSPNGTITIYQPELDTLEGRILRGRAATSLTKGSSEPIFGALWFEATVEVDQGAKTVSLQSLNVTRVRVPDLTDDQLGEYERTIEEAAPKWNLVLPLDQVETALAASAREQASARDYKSDPPKVLFSQRPAVLVVFDGQPELRPVENSTYQRVVNTQVLIFQAPGGDAYLSSGKSWYTARNPLGPWRAIASPPREVEALVPPDTSSTPIGAVPEIITSTEPAELIVTDGPPAWTPLPGNELLYANNTESNLIEEIEGQKYWVLLSGRWYTSRSLEGPWSFVEPSGVPPSFRRIPADSPVGDVLAQVPGTTTAENAQLDAEIPQTAAVKRSDASLDVEYEGTPMFESVETSGAPSDSPPIQYAINTGTPVLSVDGRFYAVDNGMWFVADTPTGPWILADYVPPSIDYISPSSPVYGVRYIRIYRATPSYVYVGYLPGYVGTYRYRGTVIYGTGWRYRPWIGRRYYFPRPMTWGIHVVYNPYSGSWGMTYGWGAPFINVYLTWWGNYYHRPTYYAGWWGPGGYRPVYHPRPGWRPPYRPPRNVAVITRPYPNRPGVAPARPRPRDNIYARPELRDRVVTRPRPVVTPRPVRPAVPEARPGRPSERPTTPARPRPRPTQPSERPAPRPSPPSPPAARPSPRPETRPAPRPSPPPPRARPSRPSSPPPRPTPPPPRPAPAPPRPNPPPPRPAPPPPVRPAPPPPPPAPKPEREPPRREERPRPRPPGAA
jgi:hypothetical protein